jgi:hypothetical protein
LISTFFPTQSKFLSRVALSGNIVLLVLLKLPKLPVFYQGMCTIPVLAVVNSMACIVYRKIKFGVISPDGTANFQSFGSLHFQAASNQQFATNTSLPMHIRHNGDPTASGPFVTLHASSTRLDLPTKGGMHIIEDPDSHHECRPGQM